MTPSLFWLVFYECRNSGLGGLRNVSFVSWTSSQSALVARYDYATRFYYWF